MNKHSDKILKVLTNEELNNVSGSGVSGIGTLETSLPTWKFDKHGSTPALSYLYAHANGYELEGV